MKQSVASAPASAGSGSASRKRSTYSPLGITTGSPPTCCTWVSRAYSETAIRAVIRSSRGRSSAFAADIARDRGLDWWNVATTGTCRSAVAPSASRLRLGVPGSCRCTTSNRPSSSQRLTRALAIGPNSTWPTAPL